MRKFVAVYEPVTSQSWLAVQYTLTSAVSSSTVLGCSSSGIAVDTTPHGVSCCEHKQLTHFTSSEQSSYSDCIQ